MENFTDYIYNFSTFLYSSFNDSISSVLDRIVFINKNIIDDRYAFKFNGDKTLFVIERLANTFLYGILIYVMFKYLLNKITNEENENITGVIYKLLIAAILIGFSKEICGFILEINGYISDEILSFGKSITKKEITFDALFKKIKLIIGYSKGEDAKSVNTILQGFVSFGLINLVLIYSLRYIYIKILCLMFPFAIVLKSNKKMEHISKAWLKSFVGLLCLQHLIAIILIFAINIRSNGTNILGKVVCVGCVYALMQINELQREIMGSSSLYINTALRAQKGGI